MRIGIIGAGHVGLVSAACFAHVGHNVVAIDADDEKIQKLRRGDVPFYEPDLKELVEAGLTSGRLTFTSAMADVLASADAAFICVGTPSRSNGEADLTQVESVAHALAEHLNGHHVVLVEKSTVPVTTGKRLCSMLELLGVKHVEVVSNPEFLREGSAVEDTLQPDRIVIGSSAETATRVLLDVYRPIVDATGCEVLVTDVQTAELIKHASNAFLATKISFINAVADVCEATGADVHTVARGMGADDRISARFLQAGVGYGGSCFPKDLAAFAALAEQVGVPAGLLREVQDINRRRPAQLVAKLRQRLWHLKDKRIAVLGLAFKAGTDDLRESPAIAVVEQLLEEEAHVVAYDPVAMAAAKDELPPSIEYSDGAISALEAADGAIFLTDWLEFRELPPRAIAAALRFPIVVDGRNLFDPQAMAAAGLTYVPVGRPVPST